MNIRTFIDENREKLDVFEPKAGHFERFSKKLAQRQKPVYKPLYFRKWFVAASIVFVLSLGFVSQIQIPEQKPQEVIQTEQYFSSLIADELESIKPLENEENKQVIEDAMQQIKLLETEYQELIKAYQVNQDKSIINDMIMNFQKRIEILQFVKKQIHDIKKFRNYG
jgi:hypothetical protein